MNTTDCWTQNDGNASLSAATNKSAAAHLPRNGTNTSAEPNTFAITIHIYASCMLMSLLVHMLLCSH